MSYLQVTTVRPSSRVPNQFNTLRRSDTRCISSPVNVFNLQNALKSSSKKCTDLMKCNVIQSASSYQQCTPMCSFRGKEESKNGNEGSPWKSIEKAMSSFKKEQSLEDVLRQQMEKQEYYDGGDPPGGGGGRGGGGGFGGPEDEGFAGMFDDILQVTLAILALIVLYLYIIAGDQVRFFFRDTFAFLAGKKGPRIRTVLYEFAQFYQKCRARVPQDPFWLEKAIIITPTYWDSPEKYRRMLNLSRPRKMDSDSDNDENTAYDEDSDNDNAYNKKAYSDDQDDNGYSDDVDDEF